jgi:hypothetical protein
MKVANIVKDVLAKFNEERNEKLYGIKTPKFS